MKLNATLLRVALAAGLVGGFHAEAQAQSNPSADDIIHSLQFGKTVTGSSRGIRPAGPTTPDTAPDTGASATAASPPRPHPPAATRSAQTAPAAPTAAPSVNLAIEFATNSTTLTPVAVKALEELGRALASPALASYRFRIEGHTDTVGSPEANKALSDRRANAVADFLATHFQIDRGRLEPIGLGEVGLLVQTPPQISEARNRRVQIVNLGS